MSRIMKRLAAFVLLMMFAAMGSAGARAGGYSAVEQFSRARIGVQTGTAEGPMVEARFPEATVSYFNTTTDMTAALEKNKIDGFPVSLEVLMAIMHENDRITYLEEPLSSYECGVAFPMSERGQKLCDEFNAFLRDIEADGTLQQLRDKWMNELDHDPVDYDALPATNGKLRMATEATYPPFEFVSNGKYAGFDVDLAARFCEACGYGLEVADMNFDAVLASVVTGKCDFAAAGIQITEERAQSVTFSQPYHTVQSVMAVLKSDASAAPAASRPELTDYSDLGGKTVSMLTGAPFEELVREKVPDVGAFTSFNNMPDMLLALKSGKTDAVLINNAIATLAVNRNPELALFPQNLQDSAFGFAFAKGDSRRDEWQAAFDAIPEAEVQAAWDKWTGADESVKVLPEQDWPGKNGTVRVAACDTLEPMSYAGEGGTPIGFDLEVIQMIARTLDVHVEFTGMEFAAILSSVQAGKADIGAGSIIITAERAEAVDFVEYYPAAFVLIVRAAQAGSEAQGGVPSLSDLEHARIGVATGTTFDEIVRKALPDATIAYINTSADLIASLEAGKIDGFAVDETASRQFCAANPRLAVVDEYLDTFEFGFVLPRTGDGERLLAELDAWLASMKKSGALEQVIEKWSNGPEDGKTLPDYAAFPAPKGTLTLVTEGDYVPLNYYRGSEIVGAEIDLVAQFCEASGYGLEVKVMNFDGILPAVQAGKADLAAAGITITDERRESVNFSVPYYAGGAVMVVLKGEEQAAAGGTEDATFVSGIKASFEKTFLREDRWRLFVDGVLTTLLITLLAILFGTALGFVIFMLCRNGNPVANAVTRFCLWLVQGMPMVVLLMILYYVVFGSVAVSGVLVAVIGFTLTFGASVFGLLKMGVGAVDHGQYEAAYALGYSNRRTFFEVILPQALPHVMPAYRGEIVSLIKATAIVGYIAVQDLTKMGDIVRSRTYEAFFPLIAVTIIYFILEELIGLVIRRIGVNINPKRRSPEKILKGVKTDDQN